jgi:hypothetical protein
VTAQVPALVVVTVTPETVHTEGVSERNDTASPEVALAVKGTTLLSGVQDSHGERL